MWNGKVTKELRELYFQYEAEHNNYYPDDYDDLDYDAMTYDEFVAYIKECLETGLEMPDVVPFFWGLKRTSSAQALKKKWRRANWC